MIGLPPGNILQYIYLKERLSLLKSQGLKSFIEIGSGNGNLSKIFLDTGNRNVKYKTIFPKVFNTILNPVMLYPFHILQKIFKNNKNNLVIYSELTLKQT